MSKDLVVQEKNVTQSPTTLIEMALTNGAEITTIEKLVDMQNKYEEKEARKFFFSSLSKFQSEMPTIGKNGNVDFKTQKGRTVYDFVRLEDIGKAIKTPLFDNSLSYRYEQEQEKGLITVTCIITHKDGHSEKMSMSSIGDSSGNKNAIQQIGSTITYLKRYTLIGALGLIISEDDDDGQGSTTEPQENPDLYPNESFNSNFPHWSKAITEGKRTKENVFKHLSDKGITLQEWQIEKISKIEEK